MRSLSIFTLVALNACAAPKKSSTNPKPGGEQSSLVLEVDNLLPAFWEWLSTVEGRQPHEQAQAFWTGFAPRYPLIYNDTVLGPSYREEKRRMEQTERFFQKLPEFLLRMRTIGDGIEATLSTKFEAFRGRFDDVAWRGPAHVVPSLLSFDGGTRPIEGKTHLLFGADGIAMWHHEDDFCAFFSHEYFHIYHSQFFPESTGNERDPLWRSLWAEGLASFVSEALCPEANEAEILMSASLANAAREHFSKIVGELKEHLDSKDEERYWRYFGGKAEDIPRRSAYYVGLLLARDAGNGRTLRELATLPTDVTRQLIVDGLAGLEAVATTPPTAVNRE